MPFAVDRQRKSKLNGACELARVQSRKAEMSRVQPTQIRQEPREMTRLHKAGRTVAACVLLFAATNLFSQTADQSSAISGTVVNESGAPVKGATVVLPRIAGPRLSKIFLSPNAVTDASGAFKFTKLPSGQYRGCALLPGTALLNPCEWFDTPSTISVAIGESKSGLTIVMKQGKLLTVRLDDAAQLLKAPVKGLPDELVKPVLVQALTKGREPHLPHTVASDSGGETHTWAVPAGVPIQLDVWSAAVSVKGQGAAAVGANVNEGLPDATGKLVAQPFQFQSSDGARQYSFTVQVKGK